jgi:hypothetical protein
MYSTTAYLYQQIQKVLLLDESGAYFQARYNPVYAKTLTINKGVDNVLLFEFINQDEKPVNISGSSFIFRLLDQSGTTILSSTAMEILNAPFGRAKVTLSAADTVALEAQPASYSIERSSGNLRQAVFTDANSGARADVNIVDSIFPELVPSGFLTIPTVNGLGQVPSPTFSQNYPDWAQQPTYQPPLGNPEYYSSQFAPSGGLTTFKLELLHYTGTIKAQAAETYQSVWYDVSESTTYLNKTGPIIMNVAGHYPLMRLAFNNSIGGYTVGTPVMAQATATVTDGVVTGITITVPGSGYIAPPNVTIVGDGAGALAESEITNGSVTAINIISGGSGYKNVPPTQTAAAVIVNTGFVTSILYR